LAALQNVPQTASSFNRGRNLKYLLKLRASVLGLESVQARGVRGVLRATQNLARDQEVEGFRNLLKLVTGQLRELLAGHESAIMTSEEQQEIQIARVFQPRTIKKLLEVIHLSTLRTENLLLSPSQQAVKPISHE
jgi:hypothetical protein